MARSIGDLEIRVGADVGGLRRDLKKGERDIQGFGARATVMAKKVAKAGAIITAGVAAATGGLLVMARSAAETGAEIERLSRLANTTPETFQKWAQASKTVGIEQDKLADILKDVQDRVGDFMATGGGPMADFFENIGPKVGVTAQHFKDLSGPDALQLYVDSLQKAGLSQSEMTFYMEAMSSDLTAMLPLLANGGREMKKLGEEAAAAGLIMSDDAVKGSVELKKELDQLATVISTQVNKAILENKEDITVLVAALVDLAPKVLKVVQVFVDWAAAVVDVVEALARLKNEGWTSFRIGDPSRFEDAPTLDPGNLPGRLGEILSGGNGNNIPRPSGLDVLTDQLSDSIDGGQGMDTLGFVAGGAGSPFGYDEQFVEDVLGRLGEFMSRRQEVISEGALAERLIHQDHAERMKGLEDDSMAARLSGLRGAFGDVSSLMQTENKKLFQIGKAAALADATISGYQAAVDAWQKGMKIGGPGVATAFTAASLARTGALISQISAQSYGGGSSAAGNGAGAGAGAGAPETSPSQYYTVNLPGDGPISRNSVRDLMRMMNEEIEGGATLSGIVVNG
ncbi:hypothetical protein [Roseovarius sp.]|uniref:hypothetical protein n=1 Tax=Roseovarius sp. TaxID=1486281 RepID=UPI003D09E301